MTPPPRRETEDELRKRVAELEHDVAIAWPAILDAWRLLAGSRWMVKSIPVQAFTVLDKALREKGVDTLALLVALKAEGKTDG